jgi:excisionase family DNA binding protein
LDTYCSVDDACSALRVSRWTIQRLIATRAITSTRVAGARRISVSSLNDYLAANSV